MENVSCLIKRNGVPMFSEIYLKNTWIDLN